VNFILHFTKFLYLPDKYDTFELVMRSISLENFCSVTVVLFPFIYLSKQPLFRNGIVYLGIITGVISFLYPTESLDRSIASLDVIRFYVQHGIIGIVPVLMLCFNIQTLRWSELHHIAIYTVLVFAFIYTSQAVFYGAIGWEGVVPVGPKNNSFQWSVTRELGNVAYNVLTWASPGAFKNYPFLSVVPSVLIEFTLFSTIILGIYKFSKTRKSSRSKDLSAAE
jgi:hypothetical protein